LRIGLGPADEVFLETALDDKRKAVRTAAADLLAQLPEAQFRVRMTERARACLRWTWRKNLLRERRLELDVTLPDAVDKAMARDGIEARKNQGMGEKAYTLTQIVAGASLAALAEDTGAKPEQFVRCARDSDFKEALLGGWSVAAARQGAGDWAAALLKYALEVPDAFEDERLAGLAACLDERAREAELLKLLAHKRADASGLTLGGVLGALRHPWSEAFSRAVLKLLQRHFGTAPAQYDHALRKTVAQEVSRYMAPVLADDAANGWPRESANWHKGDDEMVNALAATLALRRAMHKELSGDPG
ncbi:MAG TPA: DUF5691 domain-containing protein, partial [Phycisphaerae bacterium]|nr:DUF5691 domain-containing protein [Phycisphaerae bacterium]